MYTDFYGLSEKPFSLLPDPDYLYLGSKHERTLTLLRSSLESQAGFSIICGDAGTGKTTLIRHLLNELDGTTTVGLISNPHPSFGELLHRVLSAFNLESKQLSQTQMHERLVNFLIDQHAQKHHTVLIVDEAQNMNATTLKELRMLTNINADKHQVLQVILVGQPELKETLSKPELAQFVQHIVVEYHLEPLDQDETRAYIHHRMKVAGSTGEVFNDAACKAIHHYSDGTPLVINLLCDMALVYGFTGQSESLDKEMIDDMVHEHQQHSLLPALASASEQPPKPVKPKPADPPQTSKIVHEDSTDSKPALESNELPLDPFPLAQTPEQEQSTASLTPESALQDTESPLDTESRQGNTRLVMPKSKVAPAAKQVPVKPARRSRMAFAFSGMLLLVLMFVFAAAYQLHSNSQVALKKQEVEQNMQLIASKKQLEDATANTRTLEEELEAALANTRALEEERDAALANTRTLEQERDIALAIIRTLEEERDATLASIRKERDAALTEANTQKTLVKKANRTISSIKARYRKSHKEFERLKQEALDAKIAEARAIERERSMRGQLEQTKPETESIRIEMEKHNSVATAPKESGAAATPTGLSKPQITVTEKNTVEQTSFSANPCNSPSAHILSACQE